MMAFGRRSNTSRIARVMAGGRVDEVRDNVFRVPSRINSTWGGNLTDMVRAQRILEVIEAEGLIARAADLGARLVAALRSLTAKYPGVAMDARGRGLMCAISLPDSAMRDRVIASLAAERVIMLGCGERAIRFRPALTVPEEDLARGLAALDRALAAL